MTAPSIIILFILITKKLVRRTQEECLVREYWYKSVARRRTTGGVGTWVYTGSNRLVFVGVKADRRVVLVVFQLELIGVRSLCVLLFVTFQGYNIKTLFDSLLIVSSSMSSAITYLQWKTQNIIITSHKIMIIQLICFDPYILLDSLFSVSIW